MIDEQMFTCEKYHVKMPADKQQEFCARRFLKALDGDFCLECEHGKKAADGRRVVGGWKKQQNKQEEVIMAEKKLCSCGCGAGAVKDGLGWGCFANKYGKPPYKSSWEAKKNKPTKTRPGQTKKQSSSGKKGRVNAPAARSGKCEDCELARVEKIMIAAGGVSAEKFEQAREIVRELAK